MPTDKTKAIRAALEAGETAEEVAARFGRREGKVRALAKAIAIYREHPLDVRAARDAKVLPEMVANRLIAVGVSRFDQLEQITLAELQRIPRVGKMSQAAIIGMMEQLGLALK